MDQQTEAGAGTKEAGAEREEAVDQQTAEAGAGTEEAEREEAVDQQTEAGAGAERQTFIINMFKTYRLHKKPLVIPLPTGKKMAIYQHCFIL